MLGVRLLERITAAQQAELWAMLDRLARLWSELTVAASKQDHRRIEDIQAEIAACRNRVEEIKRVGTVGPA